MTTITGHVISCIESPPPPPQLPEWDGLSRPLGDGECSAQVLLDASVLRRTTRGLMTRLSTLRRRESNLPRRNGNALRKQKAKKSPNRQDGILNAPGSLETRVQKQQQAPSILRRLTHYSATQQRQQNKYRRICEVYRRAIPFVDRGPSEFPLFLP